MACVILKVHLNIFFGFWSFHQEYPPGPLIHSLLGFEYKVDFAMVFELEAHSADNQNTHQHFFVKQAQ
jgi:hypothetical protein